jgi:hypothetical protein
MYSRHVAFLATAFLLGAQPAWAHGIVGNRFFPGTMMFDDPAARRRVPVGSVSPEASVGQYDRFDVSILVVRSLVHPEIAIGIDSGRSLYLSGG